MIFLFIDRRLGQFPTLVKSCVGRMLLAAGGQDFVLVDVGQSDAVPAADALAFEGILDPAARIDLHQLILGAADVDDRTVVLCLEAIPARIQAELFAGLVLGALLTTADELDLEAESFWNIKENRINPRIKASENAKDSFFTFDSVLIESN